MASSSAVSRRALRRAADSVVRHETAFTVRPLQSVRSIHSTPTPVASSARRPLAPSTLRPAQPIFSSRRTLFIQTESTPNPDALKFKPNSRVLPEDIKASFVEYMNPRSTLAPPHPSPLASSLMGVDGVTSVFYGLDYITVTKASDAQWAHVKPEVFSLITETITSGKPFINTVEGGGAGAGGADGQAAEPDSLAYDENDPEVVSMIKELLETRIRPAIQEDGGDIEFRGFVDGWVSLKLRGACRTCDSSTVTLRNGIESMLMHYIEEVKGVQQVMDEEEQVAMQEFAKFEEKLRQQKGDAAVASQTTLDRAEA